MTSVQSLAFFSVLAMQLTSTSTLSERITALVSAAVAIALLGLAVSAQTGQLSATDPLEQLVSQTRLQFRLGLGHEQALLDARADALDKVLEAFRSADDTSENRELVTRWLREAMLRSMPGSIRPLPAAPAFLAASNTAADPSGATSAASAQAVNDPEEQIVARQQQITPSPANPSGPTREPAPLDTPQPPRTKEPTPAFEPSATTHSTANDPAADRDDILDALTPDGTTPDGAGPIPTLADPPVETPAPGGSAVEATLPTPQSQEVSSEPSPQPARPTRVSPVVATPTSSPIQAIETPTTSRGSDDNSSEAPVAVNTDRLSKEMARYHATLGTVRDACGQQTLTFAELQDAVDTLERLTTQYDFVRLYYDLLSPRKRKLLGQPTHWGVVLPEVRDALERVAQRTDGDFLRPLESDRQEALGDLRRQVDKLARQALP